MKDVYTEGERKESCAKAEMSCVDGAWTRGWAANGERVAVWHHHSGSIWTWCVDLSRAPAGWSLACRPVGHGATAPPGLGRGIPAELYDWVRKL